MPSALSCRRFALLLSAFGASSCELFVGDLPPVDDGARQTGTSHEQDAAALDGSSAGGRSTIHDAGAGASSGGNLATGGAVGSGGSSPGDGGAIGAGASGGIAGSGGTVGNGGVPGAGGTVGSGGAPGAGGTVGSGGIVGNGGALANGGTVGTGGTGGACCDCDGDGQTSKACGGKDCDDGDAAVYFGETDYQSLASKHGSFDYDCSSTLDRDPALNVIVDCATVTSLLLCSQKTGFLGSAPVCGAQGDWGTCKAGTLTCVPDVQGKMTMTCR